MDKKKQSTVDGDALLDPEDVDFSEDAILDEASIELQPFEWEALLAAEMGIDQSMMHMHNKSTHGKHLNVEKVFTEFKGTPEERKRHADFLEDTLAAYHMKDLTSKYGSIGKTAKQYFMEAYDDDTRLEGVVDEDKVHHYDAKGHEIKVHHHKAALLNKNIATNPADKIACPEIVFPITDDLLVGVDEETSDDKNKKVPEILDETERDFWASLESLQRKDGQHSDSALSWCVNGEDIVETGLSTAEEVINKDLETRPDTSTSLDSTPYHVMNDAYLDKYLIPVQEVVQSNAARKAWKRVMIHLEQFNVKDPLAYQMYGNAYEETRDFVKLPEDDVREFEGGNWEPIPINENAIFELEPPEKLLGRLSVYQKALLYMIEHFETMRPLLSEIKQAYTEVLDKCEKDWKELDKLRMEQLRRREAYAAHVRAKDKDGDRALMEVNLQIHALQEHLQWQQHTLHTILGVLSKMRHSLKMQSKAVIKTSTMYKNKVELVAKETVNSQGAAMYESALPNKYTELMAMFRNVEGKELRRILNAARRQLRKVHKQILYCEGHYGD